MEIHHGSPVDMHSYLVLVYIFALKLTTYLFGDGYIATYFDPPDVYWMDKVRRLQNKESPGVTTNF